MLVFFLWNIHLVLKSVLSFDNVTSVIIFVIFLFAAMVITFVCAGKAE